MGELKTDQWVQFICFKTRIAIGEELFQETWIPLAKALHARGINSVALSQKVNAKDDSCDFVLITKTWWDAINAIKGAFPNGLQAASLNRVAISIAQVHDSLFFFCICSYCICNSVRSCNFLRARMVALSVKQMPLKRPGRITLPC